MDERIIPEDVPRGIYAFHLTRYQFASQYSRGKDVLDAACGVGYGSYYLSNVARSVIGIDINQEAINYAREKYKADNVIYKRADLLRRLDFNNQAFDVICAFETIEHLSELNIYFSEVARLLKDDGVYLLSVPYTKEVKFKFFWFNTHHYAEYMQDNLEALLKPYFWQIEFYGQRRKSNNLHRLFKRLDIFNIRLRYYYLDIFKKLTRITGNTPFAELALQDIEIVKDDLRDADTVIAVCRRSK